ncbi:MAG: site-2 protease family protein [Planctomycetota bacterium]|nr:site-2 protease family protein [Planctomycetota bacterium]
MSDQSAPTRIDQFTFLENVAAEVVQDRNRRRPDRRGRKILLPLVLFMATCLSTFFVGCCQWSPERAILTSLMDLEGDLTLVRRMVLENWGQGLLFMVCLMGILFAHEMGHFVGTLIYKIPASFPIFLPFPLSPLGTFGAVIAMQANRADRKGIFDVGIAGPLAGLIVAIPLLFAGIQQLDLSSEPSTGFGFESPLLVKWMMQWYEVPGAAEQQYVVWCNQLNPCFAASWFGLIMTAINMFPIGQLDGGHTTYTLFGKASYWIARGTLVLGIAFIVYLQTPTLAIMILLLLLVGPDHPPTTDDTVKLGLVRQVIGVSSLLIPVLCFPPLIFRLA